MARTRSNSISWEFFDSATITSLVNFGPHQRPTRRDHQSPQPHAAFQLLSSFPGSILPAKRAAGQEGGPEKGRRRCHMPASENEGARRFNCSAEATKKVAGLSHFPQDMSYARLKKQMSQMSGTRATKLCTAKDSTSQVPEQAAIHAARVIETHDPEHTPASEIGMALAQIVSLSLASSPPQCATYWVICCSSAAPSWNPPHYSTSCCCPSATPSSDCEAQDTAILPHPQTRYADSLFCMLMPLSYGPRERCTGVHGHCRKCAFFIRLHPVAGFAMILDYVGRLAIRLDCVGLARLSQALRLRRILSGRGVCGAFQRSAASESIVAAAK
ncbi:uncharacterized protein MYCFIDRAFT_180715 [Pseudocercospora fijiensis CIRAD86]|uniref:Uncharacterized protein n=1 Tax=Pseudocercospora fijiensis (strain CIRAD86) TaxID=383855 RepID=M2YG81_PSEFD|nr:uncharacterized protein MYCFIDRAFT_180715 [Pseudocercospora fijiensis CIRAD86]EME76810.1 hypothetical protein MYCFIDRAFT_180715 [Pseudocercospora fijiensis CIRAD86]